MHPTLSDTGHRSRSRIQAFVGREGVLHIIHIALGGCLKAPPISYGLTADTGGHIAYVLDAALAQAASPDVSRVEVFTRRFQDPRLGLAYAQACEPLSDKLEIVRLQTSSAGYLDKEALRAEVPDFAEAFCRHLERRGVLPDVIHAHFADAALIAAAARRRFGVPFVYTPHSLGLDKARTRPRTDMALRIADERLAITDADRVIVSTDDERDLQLAGYGVAASDAKTAVIAPGVPRSTTAPDDAAMHRLLSGLARPDKPILLAIARPVRKKNLAGLVEAFAGSPELRERANLVILAGQDSPNRGPEEQAVVAGLHRRVRAAGLQDRVAMPATHDGALVQALYGRAAEGGVFVNPAHHEPFGLTVLEAAAAGAPVVATRAGGPSDIVRRIGHGLLVDPSSPREIAEACLTAIRPAEHRRFSERGKAGAALYDWTRYTQSSLEVYKAALPEPELLVCDIDGTLTGCREAAARFSAWCGRSRAPFVVATGRRLEEALAILDGWGLPQPDALITDVGTAIYRPAGGGWRLCDGYHANLLADWDRDSLGLALGKTRLQLQPDEAQTDVKLSCFGTREEAERLRAQFAALALPARVIHSHTRMIDILPVRGGKARALFAYAASRGWSLAQCVAAGDSGNDLDMLNASGRAIVVANADPDLDGLAPRAGVTRSRKRHADGVLEGLAHFGAWPVAETRAA